MLTCRWVTFEKWATSVLTALAGHYHTKIVVLIYQNQLPVQSDILIIHILLQFPFKSAIVGDPKELLLQTFLDDFYSVAKQTFPFLRLPFISINSYQIMNHELWLSRISAMLTLSPTNKYNMILMLWFVHVTILLLCLCMKSYVSNRFHKKNKATKTFCMNSMGES